MSAMVTKILRGKQWDRSFVFISEKNWSLSLFRSGFASELEDK
jgi:hypothetical protein